MPKKYKLIDQIDLNRFVKKRLLYYVVPNFFFNTLVAYASFNELGYTHFFEGQQSLARLTLPMCLLLPLIITIDIIKRTIKASDKGIINFTVDNGLKQNHFMFKMGLINGTLSCILILTLLYGTQQCLPPHYKLNVLPMAFLVGTLAVLLSVIFTYVPIKKLLKHLHKT